MQKLPYSFAKLPRIALILLGLQVLGLSFMANASWLNGYLGSVLVIALEIYYYKDQVVTPPCPFEVLFFIKLGQCSEAQSRRHSVG